MMNSKKEEIIAMLRSQGYSERLNLQRPYGELVSLATNMGVTLTADDKACVKRRRS